MALRESVVLNCHLPKDITEQENFQLQVLVCSEKPLLIIIFIEYVVYVGLFGTRYATILFPSIGDNRIKPMPAEKLAFNFVASPFGL
ncbi:MAG TPA: hypothetical protein VM260_19285 [Pirellula sp.]|nr:hypothetical protein [Pirellula sp.]